MNLMDKVDSMQKQMSNISRKVESYEKKQKEMLEIRNHITEMNVFDRLSSRPDVAEERLCELEGIAKENSKSKKQEQK